MPRQITVRLPDDLGRALATAARRGRRKSSEIVRLALEEYLGAIGRRGGRAADRVRSLIGALDSGIPDLAERHRDYLRERLKRGR